MKKIIETDIAHIAYEIQMPANPKFITNVKMQAKGRPKK